MSIKKWHVVMFLFVTVAGFVSHFLYGVFDNSHIAGYFFPVNESVWEHLKLIYWPALLFMTAEYISYGKGISDFFAVKATALFCTLIFTVVFFYTYTGILGFNMLFVDVAVFFAATILYTYISAKLMCDMTSGNAEENIKGVAILVLLALCFVFWSYNPPDIALFWG